MIDLKLLSENLRQRISYKNSEIRIVNLPRIRRKYVSFYSKPKL